MADVRHLGRLVAYAAFGGMVGGLSAWPEYRRIDEGAALLRLSFRADGRTVGACREPDARELAGTPQNMRRPLICPRERAPVGVSVAIDGVARLEETVAPRGMARDGSASLYRTLVVPAGEHRIDVRLDGIEGAAPSFGRTLTLAPRSITTIDLDPTKGSLVLR